MANYIVCVIVQRLILPIVLSICCLLRPTGLSLPYLLLLFYLPFIPVANHRSIKGHTGFYLLLLICISVLLCLVQIAFQIFLAVVGNEIIEKCQLLEIILRHVGLVRLDELDVLSIIQWLAPEIISVFGSIIIYIILRKGSNVNMEALNNEPMSPGEVNIANGTEQQQQQQTQLPNTEFDIEKWRILVRAGKIFSLLVLCATGALQPSVLSVIYYLTFLFAATWWGMNRQLERGFGIVLRVISVFMMLHITTFLTYQNPWPQEFVPPNSTLQRVLGIAPIYSSSCDNSTDIRVINFNFDLDLDHYLNPIALIICYIIIGLTSVLLLDPQGYVRKVCPERLTSEEPNERTPLMRSGTRRVADSKPDAPSVTNKDDTIQMHQIEKDEEEDDEQSAGFCEQLALAASSIADFIYKNSYIFTNVVMMSWSIIYHSWLGFVLLIWANLIWVIPNQRKNMLGSSPFLVIYAEILLLITYLYGMDLNLDELPADNPSDSNATFFKEIGLVRYYHYPIGPIMMKSVFTVMFLSSLRQMIQENKAKKQNTALADMVAPLQLTVSAATAREGIQKKAEKESVFITKAAKFINTFLIKFWIIIVAITLFVCGITGQQMTVFRIAYMALFLIFVLTFQFSYSVWRKFMYGFWLLVILYSMIILILVYTYQFKKTKEYIDTYLGIDEKLQHDLGLEQYNAKQLFLHLVTPTLIVIITVIQLHYCHVKFLEMSEIPESPPDDTSKTSSVAYGTFVASGRSDNENDDEDRDITEESEDFLNEIKIRKLSRQEIQSAAKRLLHKLMHFGEILLLFLEIHYYKIMLISVFLLAVNNVELLHFAFVILGVAGLRAKTESQFLVTRIGSLISSILLITTMIYQVDYIEEINYESNCNGTLSNTTDVTNNAIWIGFKKATSQKKLGNLIRPYLIYIVIVSIHSFITLYQTIKRIKQNKPPRTPTVVFKNIKRADADRDIPHLIKYLINYGFYKFGIEICLIGYLIVIGYRMDIVACCYAIWLCFLYKIERTHARKIWNYAIYFLIISIPIQYLSLIGLPPGLCINYAWKNVPLLKDFNNFAFLPDTSLAFKFKSKLLILDFILLLMMCRQLIIFRIETRYENSVTNYPGGSNQSVLKDIDQLGTVPFINPTHDFIDKIRNYLDIIKRFVFVIFFWATLAIVFLTGASRVNLLSLGYIIGSFYFLWLGTDFYLRPIYVILRWWNYLIAYNVTVVVIKTLIQLVGCLLIRQVAKPDNNYYCPIVQLFGITCICATKYPDGEELIRVCDVPLEDSGLFWDGVCFAFLILQRRMFSSHYFCHVINEAKASLILASRGNELIEELRKKEMAQEAEREAQILQKIKMKMDRIKATQQRILEENEPKTHAAEGAAPLARAQSLSSAIGYHTPVEDEDDDDDVDDVAESMFVEGEGLSEIPTDLPGISISRGESFIGTTQAPSPSSAVMTISLDAYLDPTKISYGSPADYDMPRISSPDETFPVFSPPPLDDRDSQTIDQNMLVPPNMNGGQGTSGTVGTSGRRHRRLSSLNTVSWPNPNELTVSPRQRRMSTVDSLEVDEAKDMDDEKSLISPRIKSPRRKSSYSTSIAPDELTLDPSSRRRSSFVTSWAIDDDDDEGLTTTRASRRRKYSWGPVGESCFRDSIRSASSRSPVSHHESIRSGDYYMFEDIEDEFELDLIHQRDSDDEEEKKSATRRRLSKKMNFSQYLNKMKEDSEKERLEQLEQEEIEKKKLMSRRSSSPLLRHSASQLPDYSVAERSAHSEPIPKHTFDPSSSYDDETEGLIQHDGARPSTSRGFRDDEDSSIIDERSKLIKDRDQKESDDSKEEEEKKETEAEKKRKIMMKKLMRIPELLSSILVSLTLRLHRVSRSYRYVMRVLAREKKTLKHSPNFGAGFRSGANMIWTPIQHAKTTKESPAESGSSTTAAPVQEIVVSKSSHSDSDSLSSSNCIAQADDSLKLTLDDRTDRELSMISSPAQFSTSEGLHPMGGIGAAFALMQRDRAPPPSEVEEIRRSSWIAPEIRILAPSLERGIDDDSETPFKYGSLESIDSQPKDVILKIDDEEQQADEDDFASKEHNIIVELIHALWYVVLSHTDFICYAMVFLNQINNASILSLPLPLMVLLWGTLTFPRPSKTFWVTLIAYTQAVVLIKCLCQFEFTDRIELNRPFAPSKILGIEKKDGYATYDLMLLLVVFCHRIILKSLGLWKSEVPEKTIVPGEKYKLELVNKEIAKESKDIVLINEKKPDENGKSVRVVDDKDTVIVEETVEEPEGWLGMIKISCQKYLSSIKEFVNQLFDRQSKKSADVYGFLFLCDFINFFVILFGFSAFGSQEGDGGVLSYFEENKVPVTFLLMLIIQFFLIVIDRALYLRKNMFGKIIFQIILIIGLHIWMFFVLPATTERSFNSNKPPIYYYLIKCLHLLFSAYQIRCGYPSRILGNFLTKGFTMLNFAGFKVFMNIPFLMELRTLMDWVWTDTSMTLFDWLKMEDIFANIYQLKCSRQMESDLPAPRGQKKGSVVKYAMGGGMILGIIAVIWFPLALFAFSNTVGEPNRPEDVTISLRIGPYEPIYAMSAQGADIIEMQENDWDAFQRRYIKHKAAITFLSNYEPSDVAAIKLGANSSTTWNISPPDKERLLEDLYENRTLTSRFKYFIKRKSHSKENPGSADDEHTFDFKGNDTIGLQLRKMLETSTGNVTMPFMMPKFLKVKNSGLLRPAHQLIITKSTNEPDLEDDDDKRNFRNLTLRIYQGASESSVQFWWEVTESCNEVYYTDTAGNDLYADCKNYIMMYTFNDKIFPSTISSIAAGGIIGLYTTLIFVFSRMLRSTIFSGSSNKIMFEDLPYVDRILQLCLDIYLVRESFEFGLEEDLFAKLIFLYRSPETMIKWTRPKNEKNEDDTDSISDDTKNSLKKKNE
ncbi:hypothetical protein PVAND_005679 [Polypedilum vanderplanki]|uniref:Piezo-type mechanosensitive ion channel component n=1 Tax=Polypedilum vanderplanki TaxID=319348 RepID=A0A9J6C1R6_POLVA|nr:hypothetical protein PVAND_005679 [Polypedilum vanderplanki]